MENLNKLDQENLDKLLEQLFPSKEENKITRIKRNPLEKEIINLIGARGNVIKTDTFKLKITTSNKTKVITSIIMEKLMAQYKDLPIQIKYHIEKKVISYLEKINHELADIILKLEKLNLNGKK